MRSILMDQRVWRLTPHTHLYADEIGVVGRDADDGAGLRAKNSRQRGGAGAGVAEPEARRSGVRGGGRRRSAGPSGRSFRSCRRRDVSGARAHRDGTDDRGRQRPASRVAHAGRSAGVGAAQFLIPTLRRESPAREIQRRIPRNRTSIQYQELSIPAVIAWFREAPISGSDCCIHFDSPIPSDSFGLDGRSSASRSTMARKTESHCGALWERENAGIG